MKIYRYLAANRSLRKNICLHVNFTITIVVLYVQLDFKILFPFYDSVLSGIFAPLKTVFECICNSSKSKNG